MPLYEYRTIADSLVRDVPEFGPILERHVATFNKVIPYGLFHELTEFVLAANERGDEDTVRRALNFLDAALREGDEMVQDLVGVGFVENLEPWTTTVDEFASTWPNGLREELQRQRDWRRL